MNQIEAFRVAPKAIQDEIYTTWLCQVRAQFPQDEEFKIASDLYSFRSAFYDGMTPEQAYQDFDSWVMA